MIRRLVPADVDAYRAVRLDALRLHPEAFSSSYEEESAYPVDQHARFLSPPSAVFGVFSGDRLVGIAGLYALERLKQKHKGNIVGVYVDTAHRGTGFSRGLLQAVIAEARRTDLRLVQLTVTVGNDRARRLYASLGFQSYGIERRALLVNGMFHDEEFMALDLD
jgi:RimJ/RimL family protein N-acetyltransferase